jgi:hypothetical protein
MATLKTLSCVLAATISSMTYAADFEFDRPGEAFGTGITPVGQVAWEQGLPTVHYSESKDLDGQKVKTTTLNADLLLRTGLTKNLELQLGWDGPTWAQTKVAGDTSHDEGLGDISVGLKRSIDLGDDRLSMAVLAQAKIATGNERFSEEDDIYSLGSSLHYQYDDQIDTGLTMRYEIQDGKWAIVAIPNLSYELSNKWSGFSELVYRKAESSEYESTLISGVVYRLNPRVQFDASLGADLNGPGKNYHSGLGVAFLF